MCPRVYEGHYLELFDGSIWTVKGCCHEGFRVAAMPRVVGGRKYKGYGSGYEIARDKYRRYLSKPSFTVREIPMVPISDVRTIIPPLRKPRCVDETKLGAIASEVIEILEGCAGGEWMITGSLLYCGADERSDIDVISYSAGPEYLGCVKSLIDKGMLRRPVLSEAVAEAQEDLEGMSPGTRILRILRGGSSLYYKDRRITIKVVRCDREKVSRICSSKYSLEKYAAVIEIEDPSDGALFPYIYTVRIVRAYAGDIYEGERLIAYSHRIRYASIEKGSRLACIGVIERGSDGERYVNLDQGLCSFWD